MAKNKNIFVTITGFNHYYGLEPFKIGNLIRCIKEPSNPYDSDAIRAFLPYIGKVGYMPTARRPRPAARKAHRAFTSACPSGFTSACCSPPARKLYAA